ncbi:GSCOCG00005394001-RA-CDS [Cotesia congregata]|nr:GSCOCG00005394001-RA-CDS [Cotesia congregata]
MVPDHWLLLLSVDPGECELVFQLQPTQSVMLRRSIRSRIQYPF